MDIQTIDNAYAQLQGQAQQTIAALQTLATKLQTAAQAGDQNAREWSLDLREIAIALQNEQSQVGALLQAMHAFGLSAMQQPPVAPPPGYAPPAYAQPVYGAPPPNYGAPQGGNPLQGFLNSGFGRAMEMGAGFGLADDLIHKIF